MVVDFAVAVFAKLLALAYDPRRRRHARKRPPYVEPHSPFALWDANYGRRTVKSVRLEKPDRPRHAAYRAHRNRHRATPSRPARLQNHRHGRRSALEHAVVRLSLPASCGNDI